jgi:hypothetical protein
MFLSSDIYDMKFGMKIRDSGSMIYKGAQVVIFTWKEKSYFRWWDDDSIGNKTNKFQIDDNVSGFNDIWNQYNQ